jgi:hypothetical protein
MVLRVELRFEQGVFHPLALALSRKERGDVLFENADSLQSGLSKQAIRLPPFLIHASPLSLRERAREREI